MFFSQFFLGRWIASPPNQCIWITPSRSTPTSCAAKPSLQSRLVHRLPPPRLRLSPESPGAGDALLRRTASLLPRLRRPLPHLLLLGAFSDLIFPSNFSSVIKKPHHVIKGTHPTVPHDPSHCPLGPESVTPLPSLASSSRSHPHTT